MIEFSHETVLLEESIKALNIRPDGIYVDGTLGGGGHSEQILKGLKTGRLIGIDQDKDAIEAASKRLKGYKDRFEAACSNFERMGQIVKALGYDRVNGIMLDLGVSSFQIDEESRGFSYIKEDAALDMRMNREQKLTAEEIINSWPAKELARLFKEYGEERYAKRISDSIEEERNRERITTAGRLNEIISRSIPAKARYSGGHPSKRVFMALRIEVNRELEVLKDSIDMMINLLEDKGRLCIITFHSLEDRIVKQAFRRNENPCICPKELPVCVCGRRSKGRVVTRHPIIPQEEEILRNSRSKSAKLRVFERVI